MAQTDAQLNGAGIARRILVARISRLVADGHYHVTVRGRLTRGDLKRLEQLCGPAFEHEILPLTIQLEDSTELDDTASFFLTRLASRGARVDAAAAPTAAEVPTRARDERSRDGLLD